MENTRAVLIEELRQEIDRAVLVEIPNRMHYGGCYGISDLNDNFLEAIVRIISKSEDHTSKEEVDNTYLKTIHQMNGAIARKAQCWLLEGQHIIGIIKAAQKVVDFDANEIILAKKRKLSADMYEVKQELFNYLSNELDATAMDTQLEDIIHICNRLNNK
jgi:hypothetical protein